MRALLAQMPRWSLAATAQLAVVAFGLARAFLELRIPPSGGDTLRKWMWARLIYHARRGRRELFDRIARTYSAKDQQPYSRAARRHRLLSSVARLPKIGSLLEIGCGAEYLAGRFERYVGLDYSAELIAVARECHRQQWLEPGGCIVVNEPAFPIGRLGLVSSRLACRFDPALKTLLGRMRLPQLAWNLVVQAWPRG